VPPQTWLIRVQPTLSGGEKRESVMRLQWLLWLIAASVIAWGLGASPASSQDDDVPDTKLSAKAKAVPNKAGTRRDPRGMTIHATAKIDVEPGFEPPIVTGLDVLIGKGLHWNGDRYPKCTKRTLNRKGPKGCPRRSIMGDARLTAYADTVVTHPDVVFVNGGTNRTFAYTTLYHPTLVQEAIPINRTKMSGKWDHRETIRVPESLQVVAGVPILVTAAEMHVGGKPYAREFVYSTSCPKGGWKYRAITYYRFDLTGETSQDSFDGSIPCRK
jgi:hypothetical protein